MKNSMKPRSAIFVSIALASTCFVASPVVLAAPAPAFLPVLQQMRRELPSGWLVRLPSNRAFANKYIPVLFPWEGDVHIVLKYNTPECMRTAGTGGNYCVAGRIIFSRSLGGYQRSGERIILTDGVPGFYGEGEAASGIYRGVTWRQDNQVYQVNGRIPRSDVLSIARSMATQQPIFVR